MAATWKFMGREGNVINVIFAVDRVDSPLQGNDLTVELFEDKRK